MGWLKREFVSQAFGKIGLSYEFDLQSEQRESALRDLDSMMAEWDSEGIRLGYPLPSTADGSSLDQDSHVPDRANMAIVANLAMLLAEDLGRPVPATLPGRAKRSYDLLLEKSASIPVMQMPSMPAGAGNKCTERPFTCEQADGLAAGDDNEFDFE